MQMSSTIRSSVPSSMSSSKNPLKPQHSFSNQFDLNETIQVTTLNLKKSETPVEIVLNELIKKDPEKIANVHYLVLSQNDLGQDQFEQLLSGITAADFKELSAIDLSHNRIKNLRAFKTWLEKTNIQEIDLGFNELQDDSIEIICELKKSHPDIHINGNYFTAKGIQDLQKETPKFPLKTLEYS